MRKILVFLLVIISFSASAQRIQKITNYGYAYNRLGADTLFYLPSDTFSIPAFYQSYHFMAKKGSSLYLWNTSTFKWEALSTGGGGSYTFPYSVVAPGNAIQLENDTTVAVSNYVYGTNSAGRRTWLPQSSIVGATPTLQQVLTAGSTLSTNNFIDINATFFGLYNGAKAFIEIDPTPNLEYTEVAAKNTSTSNYAHFLASVSNLDAQAIMRTSSQYGYGRINMDVNSSFNKMELQVVNGSHLSEIDIDEDSIMILPPNGILNIDSLREASNMTDMKVILRKSDGGIYEIDKDSVGGSGGGTPFLPVTGTGTATGNIYGDLDGNTLNVSGYLYLDPTAGAETALLGATNLTGGGNASFITNTTTNSSATFHLQSEFNDYTKQVNITGLSNATTSSLELEADSIYIKSTISGASPGDVWTLVDETTGSGYWAAGGGGTPSLTQYRIAVGDASNQLSDAAAITGNRALISDANGVPTHSATTATELGYVSGVTSAIQTQISNNWSQSLNSVSGLGGIGTSNSRGLRFYTNNTLRGQFDSLGRFNVNVAPAHFTSPLIHADNYTSGTGGLTARFNTAQNLSGGVQVATMAGSSTITLGWSGSFPYNNELNFTNAQNNSNIISSNNYLEFKAPIKYTSTTITSNTTLSTTSMSLIYVDATSGNVTVTLPAASTITPGVTWRIVRIDNSGNTITVAAAGSDTINGAASKTIVNQYDAAIVQGRSSTTWVGVLEAAW